MFPDRKQIIRIWSTAACAGLLLLSLTQPSLTGAQESSTPDGDTASCERVNALLDAALTSTEWAIYPAQADAKAQALADAALRVEPVRGGVLARDLHEIGAAGDPLPRHARKVAGRILHAADELVGRVNTILQVIKEGGFTTFSTDTEFVDAS